MWPVRWRYLLLKVDDVLEKVEDCVKVVTTYHFVEKIKKKWLELSYLRSYGKSMSRNRLVWKWLISRRKASGRGSKIVLDYVILRYLKNACWSKKIIFIGCTMLHRMSLLVKVFFFFEWKKIKVSYFSREIITFKGIKWSNI